MAVHAQFLFFYIDEFVKHHWVDWIEGPLSEVPPIGKRHARGFQQVLGNISSGPRTRAGEAYKLGMLSDRIVRVQAKGTSFPAGWQAVIEGRRPVTELGYYAYIIGKALRGAPEDAHFERALDCLASILIMHIGFEHSGRWYSTVLLFRYAHEQLRNVLGRELSDEEVRYLAAALIHTLESDESGFLLEPYCSGGEIKQLRYDLKNGDVVHFDIGDLPQQLDDGDIGINDFKKTKAALFWAQSPRGIYTRAVRGRGIGLISELMLADRKCAERDDENPITVALDTISKNGHNKGIFDLAEKTLTDFPAVISEWYNLEAELFDAANRAVEVVEIGEKSDVFFFAQREIRRGRLEISGGETNSEEVISGSSLGYDSQNDSTGKKPQIGDAKKPQNSKSDPHEKKSSNTMKMPSEEDISKILVGDISVFIEEPPISSDGSKNKKIVAGAKVTKSDLSERDAKNRDLGEAGELFILLYERKRLKNAGLINLAEKVVWVSKEFGDGLGYDISSFDSDGSEIFLEVKTTSGGKATPFYVSKNEIDVSALKGPAYRLVRVYRFPQAPKFFTISGNLTETLLIEAISYRARVI